MARTIPPLKTWCTAGLAMLAALAAGCASSPSKTSHQPSAQARTQATPSAPRPRPQAAPTSAMAVPREELKPSAPARYVVKTGDTLWGIASQYLHDPWYWPEIWYANSQVKNPHLIYPGDVLTLSYIDGAPRLQVAGKARASDGQPATSGVVVRHLSPRVRARKLADKDFRIPIQAVRPFIIRPRIVTEQQLQHAPYIMASRDRHLIYGGGDHVYVRGLKPGARGARYSVYRPGKLLLDPATGEQLGYQAVRVADADVIRDGDPAIVGLTDIQQEALKGDRLLPAGNQQDKAFFPRAPKQPVHGEVISFFNAISEVGQYQIVVLNLGIRDGIKKGHVVAIKQAGRIVKDPLASGDLSKKVKLPDEHAGVAMVFRTFKKVSYALVMRASRPIQIGDTVARPEPHAIQNG